MLQPNEIAELWRRHAGGLVLLARSRQANDAEDLVQEAFLRLAKQTVAPRDPLAWLVRTVRNLCVDLARRSNRRKHREQQFARSRDSWLRHSAPTTEVSISEVLAALEHLPPESRDLLIAHLWNGMTFEQIGDAFEMSSSTANRRYQQALKKLRDRLRPSAGEIVGHKPPIPKSMMRTSHE